MFKRVAVAGLCALIAPLVFAASYVPKKNTHAAIRKYVQEAAEYVAKHGPSCDEFAEKDWRGGDSYIIVQDAEGNVVCHPDASLIGTPVRSIVDANGKKVGELIEAAGMKPHGGWVDYVWPRPGTTKPVPKSVFAMHVKAPDGKTYIVGSGGYELK